MTRVYYKEAVGCFIVFDVTRGSTFEAVTKWKTDLDNKVQLPDGNPVPCVLLANKVRSSARVNRRKRELRLVLPVRFSEGWTGEQRRTDGRLLSRERLCQMVRNFCQRKHQHRSCRSFPHRRSNIAEPTFLCSKLFPL